MGGFHGKTRFRRPGQLSRLSFALSLRPSDPEKEQLQPIVWTPSDTMKDATLSITATNFCMAATFPAWHDNGFESQLGNEWFEYDENSASRSMKLGSGTCTVFI